MKFNVQSLRSLIEMPGVRLAILVMVLLSLETRGQPGSIKSRIDSLMTSKHQAGEFNGTLLVVLNGKVSYRGAFGLADEGRPLNSDTPFYLGSLAKSFTGMLIMILAEQKKLSYDDKLVEFLPELPEFMSEITIRNLLNHTSGLPDYYAMGKYEDGMTNDMVMGVVLDLRQLEFAPGEKYAYSNTGYVLLSRLIQQVSKESYRNFLKQTIFDPIGMKNSEVIDGTQPKMEDQAIGHTRSGERNDYLALTTGAGGIYSMLDDLFLYDQALYTRELVKSKILKAAFMPARLNSGERSYYGFGWMLEEENPKIVQHSGSLAGFRTFFYRDTGEKNTIILLSNYTNNVGAIKEDILKLINR